MTKKKKIIISSIVVGIVLVGIVLAIILVNLKRFDMHANDKLDFNNHTTMQVITHDANYIYKNSYYSKATEIVQSGTGSNAKMGIYSYLKDDFIIPTEYSSVSLVYQNTYANRTYFRLIDNSYAELENIVDQDGNQLNFLTHNKDKNETYVDIKCKTINWKENKDTVKTNVIKKYSEKSIVAKNVTILNTGNYRSAYFSEGMYDYETWEIEDTNGLKYINLYKIEDGKHILIQTLNNEIGVSLESQNLQLEFLTDGTPILINKRQITYTTTLGVEIPQATQYEIYDINFNLKGTSQINSYVNLTVNEARVGDYYIFQTITKSSEDKYTYYETEGSSINYYTLNTFKLNLQNSAISKINFNYKIDNITNNFNTKTVLISGKKIKNKQLSAIETLLVNERLQFKKIDYHFNSITQISSNRFLTSIDGTKNFNLIDKNYNIIARLENFSQVYATKDAIIAKDLDNTYICNYDGVVVNKINSSNFVNLYDDTYYIIKEDRTTSTGIISDYYLEELGLTHENQLFSSSSYYGEINGQYVNEIVLLNEKYATLILVAKLNNFSSYDIDVYNVDGKLLGTFILSSTIIPDATNIYYDDSNVVIKIGEDYLVLDR